MGSAPHWWVNLGSFLSFVQFSSFWYNLELLRSVYLAWMRGNRY